MARRNAAEYCAVNTESVGTGPGGSSDAEASLVVLLPVGEGSGKLRPAGPGRAGATRQGEREERPRDDPETPPVRPPPLLLPARARLARGLRPGGLALARILYPSAESPDGEDADSAGEGAKDFYPPEFGRIRRPLRAERPGGAEAQVGQDHALAEESAAAQGHVSRPCNEGGFFEKAPYSYPRAAAPERGRRAPAGPLIRRCKYGDANQWH